MLEEIKKIKGEAKLENKGDGCKKKQATMMKKQQ